MQDSSKIYIIPNQLTVAEKSNNLAVVFKNYDDEQMNRNSLDMLKKLIEGGLKLNFLETLVVQLRGREVVKLPDNIKNVFLFGIVPKKISLNINPIRNKMLSIIDKSIIYTDETSIMLNNADKKKAFWTEVTKIYNV